MSTTLIVVFLVWILIGGPAAAETRDGYRAVAVFILWPVLLLWGLTCWLVRTTCRVIGAVPGLFRDVSTW